MVDDKSTTGPEKSNANKLLKKYEEAMNKAKERQYKSKKKRKIKKIDVQFKWAQNTGHHILIFIYNNLSL